jgi:hypothetical protein
MPPMTKKSLAAGLALLSLVGCTLTQSDLRKSDAPAVIGSAGQLIAPRRCVLKFMLATRPAQDDALHQSVWHVADVQVVAESTRRALAANGLRVGRVMGELPGDVQLVLNAPPPHQIDPMIVVLGDGDSTGVQLGTPRESLDLFVVNKQGQASGKIYKDAKGLLRVTAHHADGGVRLRLVPELHHGPVRQDWAAAPGAGTFGPQSFIRKDGQQEDAFRDLAVDLVLRPGQVAVVGAVAERRGSLGHYLLAEPEPGGDDAPQQLLFIWATASEGQDAAPRPAQAPGELHEVDPPDMPARPAPGASAMRAATRRTRA